MNREFVKGFIILLSASALSSEPAIQTCGGQNGQECHCVRRTQAIQNAAEKECGKFFGREHATCIARIPFHCDLIEEYASESENAATGDEAHPMSNHCSMSCKRGDCRCNDGPVCHVAHQAKDHRK